MNKKFLSALLSFSLLLTGSLQAQQSGNYTSEDVFAKTRRYDAGSTKKYSEWRRFESRLIDNISDFKPVKSRFNKYGSDLSKKHQATGFFRTEKIRDRWWIIDPDGYAGIQVSVNSINTGNSKRNKEAFNEKFGNQDNWMAETTKQLTELGFQGAGSWSNHEKIIAHNQKTQGSFTYCINWNFMSSYGKKRGGTYTAPGHTGYPANTIFVFDPEFEAFCDEHAKKLTAYKDDPNLFGYFSDNEMSLSIKNLEGYLSLPESDHGYKAAQKWLDDRNITKEQITDQHRAEFLAFVGERYFSIVSKAIKKYDPNHLFLGSRFYSRERNTPEFMKAVGKYLDIISINYYGVWTPNQEQMKNWSDWSGKPFMITEFYTKGMDSGLPNLSGAGWQVKTQEDRGKAYQNYCLGLLEAKNCVGWHWFKYQDNDPTGVASDPSNNDSNKGLVDNYYEPYKPLTDKMKQLNLNRYQLIEYFDKK